ncbi:MAG: CvpA family protein [Clostridia bacterium]|nr:CvpA family protein [Clostridia bacterium]
MGATQIVNLVLDALIIVLIAFIVIRHSVRGFINSLMSVIKVLVAPFLAIVFNMPLARLLSNTFFVGMSEKWVNKLLLTTETVDELGNVMYEVDKIFDGIPDMVVRFMLRAGEEYENKEFIDKFFYEDSLATGEELERISEILGERVSIAISVVVAFIIIFLVVEIILLICTKLLNKLVKKVSVIKVLNIIFGALLGAAIAFLLAWVICFAIGKAFEFGQHYYPDFFKEEYLSKTIIVDFFIDHDLYAVIKKIAIN